MDVINKQYNNVCLEASNKLKVNSVVLLKNISNEAETEPLRLARVDKIKKSRDGTQRVVVVTYQNVSINKKGNWVGNPVTVERCVSDVVLVDNALNDSMLSPSSKMQTNREQISNNQEEVPPIQARPDTNTSSNPNSLDTTEETEANPSEKVATEEPSKMLKKTA